MSRGMMRILVTGSRNWMDRNAIEKVLDEYEGIDHVLIHGGSKGADMLADQIAYDRGWHVEVYPADWTREGKKAGPLRNARMVESKPDVCLAFPLMESNGTWDCVNKAREAGIPVIVDSRYLTYS